jgi:hypothetical protein
LADFHVWFSFLLFSFVCAAGFLRRTAECRLILLRCLSLDTRNENRISFVPLWLLIGLIRQLPDRWRLVACDAIAVGVTASSPSLDQFGAGIFPQALPEGLAGRRRYKLSDLRLSCAAIGKFNVVDFHH